MIRLTLAAAVLPLAAATQAPPAPIVSVGATAQRVLIAWLPGEVRCGGAIVTATPMRRPLTSLLWAPNPSLKPVSYGFDIDATGRTASIHRVGTSEYVIAGDDLAPSLAVTTFAAGAAHVGCSVTYVARQSGLGEAPIADLVSYTMTPLAGALPQEGWARVGGGGTCTDLPRPEVLVRAFPDFRSLPATPGVKDWSLVGYDLDAAGKPVNLRIVAATGNGPLSAAATKAVGQSRFAGGARTGCRYPYYRNPATLPAPPMPKEATYRPAGATCPGRHDWSTPPTLRFPEAYRRRAIEGWAVITYDVAPWGEIGNVRVAAAQPSDEFGREAMNVIRTAKVPTTQGFVGCVDRVKFKMPSGPATPGTATRPQPIF